MNLKTPKIIKDRKIRFALVGCGRISGKHISALEEHKENAGLIAVCDTEPQSLKETARKTNAQEFSNLNHLLADSDADVIVLCTPSGLHPEQTIRIANDGRHVITEKPMATRLQDGKAMVNACDQNSIHLFVVKQNRLNPTLQLLKKAVTEKRFGRIYMVNVNVFWTRPQDYYDQAKWRGTWEFDGGAFMNQASHYIDLLDWLIGPIESVHAYTSTLERNIEVEDTGVANIKWRSGAMGSLNVTMLTYPKNLEGSITILGEKGSAKVGGVAVNEIEHWEFADERDEDRYARDSNYKTDSVYGIGHPLYYENVIKVLRGETEPQTDGREGLRSLETLIAMYTSARDGRRVSLPLEY
ncbi:MAG: Gfo/Idh/MocA family oxidoreductase [Thiotrichales bacterium]|nr:Gfo/Idh/MocA family oxidoreductase [Thiotrichales bacterium]